MPHMEGIFINGEKAKFHPEDILDTDASQYTEEIGESVTAYLGEHLTNPTNPPIDTSLLIAGAAADAKETGDKISELKEDFTTTASKEDMLKSFPTDTASGAVASFADGANVPIKSLIVNIDPVQSGSGDPSSTNVRPISGWSEVNVQRTGKNLFEYDATKATTGTTTSETTRAYYPIGFSNCTLSFSAELIDSESATTANINVGKLKDGKLSILNTFISIGGITERTFTFSKDEHAVLIASDTSVVAITANLPKYRICIVTGSTATAYEPYSGQNINIQLGQTVYGGTLDVVSGVLTVDRAIADLGTLVWTTSVGGTNLSTGISTLIKKPSSNGVMANLVCEKYVISAASPITRNDGKIGIDTTGRIQCGADGTPSGHLVYELATPTTVQLTPHEVRTLLGANNIWADCGDVTAEYRADTKLYIESLTEPDADMVADANITSGQYFMVGNTLYKATANIASGGAITPNVNCTRKSLSEALNELNA